MRRCEREAIERVALLADEDLHAAPVRDVGVIGYRAGKRDGLRLALREADRAAQKARDVERENRRRRKATA